MRGGGKRQNGVGRMRLMSSMFVGGAMLVSLLLVCQAGGSEPELVWPGKEWAWREPEASGLSAEKLDALRDLVGGRGCVVRHGYMVHSWGDQAKSGDVASAMKPVLSTLMLMAVQEGRIGSVDEAVAKWEPRLRELNGGKDGGITWRHLASQTSGYGLVERPGEAYSYNDFALALYHDVLIEKVYRKHRNEVLRERLGEVLEFEDEYSFEAFGAKDRPGRLAVSVRDFARFGLMHLRGGRWREKQVLKPELVKLAISSPVPAEMPLTSGREAAMLPGQRTIGGTRNITPLGPGWYSFNWWVNGKDKEGKQPFEALPEGAYVASGHGGKRELYVIPEWDLIVWNDARLGDHDGPGVPGAARLLREAVRR
jgi:CubicO group peptidase (beta-lactamase class C family)